MTTIHITVNNGVVESVSGIPPDTEVVVIDYDMDFIGGEQISISPLNGEGCTVATFRRPK